ncbi:uncharacterized protein RHOBADRAFT_26559 [Rhodotorula graminis WP1]|uniref:amidase n=1 Tax=Rhodotorula graminis (strain WP1) TaxID=578459 RepID=A0A194S412_RHOGW|nr:uncharacterized protein RHOBADRAFT_26559 [Rhodotorula graminis WP1]KPV75250.1 hypothetical protein RHOBADRAFT_26559 [Rhodotorula graminis WP1]
MHERCNLLTEVLFNDAVKAALDLDAHYDKTGELVGPLHGVPVSIKDQVDIAGGHDSTMGLTHMINRPAPADATLIRIIRDAGGIPFVKTNVPQTMLSFECSNPLFGRSGNPHNPERITGGSSGGEGGLLGGDGSVIGIGSDIGGSLRIPAHFSGCYSIKPCAGRISSTGCRTFNAGFSAIRTSMGPMARSVSDLELMLRVQLDAAPTLAATEDVLPIPYRDVKLEKKNKLRFGFFTQDKFCRTSPACERAVRETVEALRREGHECVEFEPPSAVEAMELFVALTSAGRYETLLSHLEGDPLESSLFLATIGPKLPWFVRSALAWLVDNVVGDIQFGRLLRASKGRSVKEMQEWQYRRDQYVDATRKLLWSHHAFDAVLCPPQATPALKHGETSYLSPLALATIQWNVVDSTVGLVPVTRVDPILDTVDEAFLRRLEQEPGSSLVEKRVYGSGGVYDALDMAGLPVGVQVVGRKYDEERVIELMKVVDAALGPRGFAPGDFAAREREREKVY